MKTYFLSILAISLIFISCNTASKKADKTKKRLDNYDLSIYPKSNDSIKRYLIELTPKENEELYKIEVWAGQTKKVDCNIQHLSGEFIKKTIKGWGYSYYEFSTNGVQLSTRKACIDTILTEKLIRSQTQNIRYNSRLPIVVYCPTDYTIEYAIWSKNKTPLKAKIK